MDYGDQLVKVRYIGKGDMISTEYNGKRYAFGKAKPVSIIPIAVLRNIIQSGALFAGEIIPYTDPQQQVALQAELEGRPAPAPEPPVSESVAEASGGGETVHPSHAGTDLSVDSGEEPPEPPEEEETQPSEKPKKPRKRRKKRSK